MASISLKLSIKNYG